MPNKVNNRAQQVAHALGDSGLASSVLSQQLSAVETLIDFLACMQPSDAKLASGIIQRFAVSDKPLPVPVMSSIALHLKSKVPLKNLGYLADSANELVQCLAEPIKQIKLPAFNAQMCSFSLMLLSRLALAGVLKERIDLLFLVTQGVVRAVELQHIVHLQLAATEFIGCFICQSSVEELDSRIAPLLKEYVFEAPGVFFEVKKLVLYSISTAFESSKICGLSESAAIWYLNWSLAYLANLLPVTDFLVPLIESLSHIERVLSGNERSDLDSRLSRYVVFLQGGVRVRVKRAVILLLSKLLLNHSQACLVTEALLKLLPSIHQEYLIYLSIVALASAVKHLESWSNGRQLLSSTLHFISHPESRISAVSLMLLNVLRGSFSEVEEIMVYQEKAFLLIVDSLESRDEVCPPLLRSLTKATSHSNNHNSILKFVDFLLERIPTDSSCSDACCKSVRLVCEDRLYYLNDELKQNVYAKLQQLMGERNSTELFIAALALQAPHSSHVLLESRFAVDLANASVSIPIALKIVTVSLGRSQPQVALQWIEKLTQAENRGSVLYHYLKMLQGLAQVEACLLKKTFVDQDETANILNKLSAILDESKLSVRYYLNLKCLEPLQYLLDCMGLLLDEAAFNVELNGQLSLDAQAVNVLNDLVQKYAHYISNNFNSPDAARFGKFVASMEYKIDQTELKLLPIYPRMLIPTISKTKSFEI
jgi:hypothetical protein